MRRARPAISCTLAYSRSFGDITELSDRVLDLGQSRAGAMDRRDIRESGWKSESGFTLMPLRATSRR
jgi:hypothetical protein